MDQIERLQAINQAIWLRDNCERISREMLIDRLRELSDCGLFSSRQLAKICNNKLSHASISQYIEKRSNSGGKIAPESLEDVREALFSKERGAISYPHIKSALEAGTSQTMVSRMTGINQSGISRMLSNG
jgi:hypothetical protein